MSRCTCTRGGSVVTAVTYGVWHPFQRMPRSPHDMRRSQNPRALGRDAYRGLLVPSSSARPATFSRSGIIQPVGGPPTPLRQWGSLRTRPFRPKAGVWGRSPQGRDGKGRRGRESPHRARPIPWLYRGSCARDPWGAGSAHPVTRSPPPACAHPRPRLHCDQEAMEGDRTGGVMGRRGVSRWVP